MKTKNHVVDAKEKERLVRVITDILRNKPEVLFVYLHGSFTEELPFHDIDVAIYFSEAREADVTLEALELSDRLSRELGIPVDVRALNFASTPFQYQALRGRLLFEKDQDRTARFTERTVRRYLDIKPFLLAGMKEAFAA
jgi:hypothetical protein